MYSNLINEKIELLNEFGILSSTATRQEEAVRRILSECNNEIQVEQKLHDILCGNETLKDFITRHSMAVIRQHCSMW